MHAQLIETITVLINRIILNDHLLQPKPKKRYDSDAKVTKVGNDIALELERDAPNEEYIIEKTIEMASLMYEQSNAKLNLTVSLARKAAHSLDPAMVRNSWKVYRGKIAADDHAALAAQRCCGVAQTQNPLPYLGWIPRFLELFSKIRAVRKLLPKLTTPSLAVQSMKDELVSPRAMDELRRNPHIPLLPLPHSGHYYYPPADKAALHEAFLHFINIT